MRRIAKILPLAVCLAGVSAAYGQQPGAPPGPVSPPQAAAKPTDALTNGDVIKMVEAKLGGELIISKIKSSTCNFDTSIDAILKLKSAEVSEAIIKAMVEAKAAGDAAAKEAAASEKASAPPLPPDPNDPKSPHDAGIYWLAKEKRNQPMIPLEPSVYSQGKTGGMFGAAMTGGLAKAKWKAVVQGGRATLRISEPLPEFWFYFEEKSHGLSNSGFRGGASSPNEFVLVKIEHKGDHRELVVGEIGALGASSGTRSKDTIPLDFVKVSPGAYKVKPNQPLARGEYCFFYAGTNMAIGMAGGKLFDFGVDVAK